MTEMTEDAGKTTLLKGGRSSKHFRPLARVNLRAAIVKSYLGLYGAARRFGGTDAERLCRAYQIRQRLRVHLLHDVPAVDLDGDLGEVQLGCDLLVHQARGNEGKHL